MNYKETLDFLFKQLPMYQKVGKAAFKKDLTNTLSLCEIVGNPNNKFKSVHVAGTNGKGSTTHMLASVFQEAGYKTGMYTSPHLKDYRERIRVNGAMISEEDVISFVEKFQKSFATIQPSFFEWTIALAFHHFAQEKVDIAIVETGLGGRLDSTNIIKPELSIITNIGLDHTDMLGDTLDKIAFEKAGIIKENTPVVIGDHSGQLQVFERIAQQKKANMIVGNDITIDQYLETDLLGSYQSKNTKTVYLAWKELVNQAWEISEQQFKKGLRSVVANTGLRGRWEVLQQKPLIIAETAHNEDGIKLALEQLGTYQNKRVHFVIGFVADKNIESILKLFPKTAHYYFCQANIPRALNHKKLKEIALHYNLKGNSYESVEGAVKAAKLTAQPTDIIYVGGSNFVVAEAI